MADDCSCRKPRPVGAGTRSPLAVRVDQLEAALAAGLRAPAGRAAAATEAFDQPFPTPEYPPREWFEGPPDWVEPWREAHGLGASDEGGILRLTVTDEGRVGGWWYQAGSCIIHDHAACPEPSPTGYAAFHQSDVICDDGRAIRCGVIGNTNGHASPFLEWKDAQRKYADPDCQMIVCRAGDDERGGWIAGAVKPGATYGDVALLRRSGLSGDWRPFPQSWFRDHGVDAATVRAVEGYDALGPTLVTRPALPLVRAFAPARGRAAAILGGCAGVQLEPPPPPARLAAATKREAGKDFGPRDYAYVPDPEQPSTWKLRLTTSPGGEPDAGMVGRAVTALGKGYRGNRVSLPRDDREKVKRRLRGAWARANPGRPEDEMPDVIRAGARVAAGGDASKLIEWYVDGADGQIDWGEHGAFADCVAIAGDHVDDPEAFCAQRHFDATGEWPGAHKDAAVTAAAGDLAGRLRALSQELATGQHRTGAKPGSLMSPLLSAAALLERGDEAKAAARLDDAVEVAEQMEADHPALEGLTDRVQAMADELAGARRAYSVDQSRDERGRFGEGSGDTKDGGDKGGGSKGDPTRDGRTPGSLTKGGKMIGGDGKKIGLGDRVVVTLHQTDLETGQRFNVEGHGKVKEIDGGQGFGVKLDSTGKVAEFKPEDVVREKAGYVGHDLGDIRAATEARGEVSYLTDHNARLDTEGKILAAFLGHPGDVYEKFVDSGMTLGEFEASRGAGLTARERVEAAAARAVAAARRAYSPDQSRDSSGRFGEGDGDAKGDGKPEGDGTKPEDGASIADRFYAGEQGLVLPVEEVATFTDRLAELTKDLQPGQRVNLCEVSVEGTNLFCGESQGIARQEMPQFKGNAVNPDVAEAFGVDKNGEVDVTQGFLDGLRERGVAMTDERVPAASLKATQNELRGEKVAGMVEAAKAGKFDPTGEPIVVSKDNYVIDGHHRWAAAVTLDADDGRLGDDQAMPVVRVDMGISDLLQAANDYTEGLVATKAGAVTVAAAREQERVAVARRAGARRAYSEDQARDDRGRFGEGGGGGGGGDKGGGGKDDEELVKVPGPGGTTIEEQPLTENGRLLGKETGGFMVRTADDQWLGQFNPGGPFTPQAVQDNGSLFPSQREAEKAAEDWASRQSAAPGRGSATVAGNPATLGVRVMSEKNRTVVDLPDGTRIVSEGPQGATVAEPADTAAGPADARTAADPAMAPSDAEVQDAVDAVNEGDAGSSLQDQVNDLNDRVSALEEWINAQMESQMASILAADVPLPAMPDPAA